MKHEIIFQTVVQQARMPEVLTKFRPQCSGTEPDGVVVLFELFCILAGCKSVKLDLSTPGSTSF